MFYFVLYIIKIFLMNSKEDNIKLNSSNKTLYNKGLIERSSEQLPTRNAGSENKFLKIPSYQLDLKPIEVIEPYKPQIITFETIDEFNLYYNRHPEEFANMTTQKLNMKYKIPGYRITQPANSERLKLIKDYYKQRTAEGCLSVAKGTQEERQSNGFIDELINRIEYLEKQVENITNFLTEQTN